MDTEYIIVQAGGLGTRLKHLTSNRPKSLVPVNNLPILFHLFKRFPDKRFIVIGDYKFEVLERYLRTFSDAEYILLKTGGKGNAAGVQKALELIPEKTPFMLVWSDLIVSEDFKLPDEIKSCYVGITDKFPCSWRFENGILEKTASEKNGVAGCFVFDGKERLRDLPVEGSLTRFLQNAGMEMTAMDMGNTVEAGTVDAIKKIDPGDNRCRPYNHMEFEKSRVTKTALTAEAEKLLDREKKWYKAVSAYGFKGIPEIYSYSPLIMQRINGDNIFRARLNDEQKKQTIDRLVTSLEELHGYETVQADHFALEEDYYTKTLRRICGIREVIPFTDREFIMINGKKCRNVFFFENELREDVHKHLFNAHFGPIHGDCTLTNTLIDDEGMIYFIDARGYFGKRELYGDIYYDWAKLYYSINGCFDRFNVKDFEFDILKDEVKFSICSSSWEHLTDYFLSRIEKPELNRIKLIHAIVWLSLASHCWEDYDSMCLAFYNGLLLWDEWIGEYR
ncbi:MAG: NTP transferase domain-containing protein [Lachnospiraceae bacterium]|nr:NTP transferase domain-containing protein [Lachnospiraceae bacterium]